MRKLLALLMCLVLLPLLPAMAEESAAVPLFRLVATDEGGQEVTLGSGLLFLSRDMLLTAAAADAVKAYGPDGAAYGIVEVTGFADGLNILVLDREAEGYYPSTLSYLTGLDGYVVGVTRDGQPYLAPAVSGTRALYDGREAALVSATEPLLPGAMMIDAWGDVMGAAVASWGEGENRYVLLTGKELTASLMDARLPETPDGTAWLMDAELSYADGLLTVDWSGCELDGQDGDSVITVFVQGDTNPYYMYYIIPASEGQVRVDVAPGYSYNVWVSHTHGELDANLSWYNILPVDIPEAEQLVDYGFTDECWLAWSPVGEEPDMAERLPELQPITAETLSDSARALYLQVVNTYAVEEEIETSLTLMLETPEGYVFHTLNGYIFMPELQTEDVWSADVSGLFTSYLTYSERGVFAPGPYTLSYLIGGQWGGRVTFTLE